MKKSISVLVLMLTFIFQVNIVFAAESKVDIKINGDIKKNNNIEILVNLKNMTNLYAASVDFEYDNNLLTVESIEPSKFILDNKDDIMEFGQETNKNGNIANYYFTFLGDKKGISGDGNFVTIKAKVEKNGKLSITKDNMRVKLVQTNKNNEIIPLKFNFTSNTNSNTNLNNNTNKDESMNNSSQNITENNDTSQNNKNEDIVTEIENFNESKSENNNKNDNSNEDKNKKNDKEKVNWFTSLFNKQDKNDRKENGNENTESEMTNLENTDNSEDEKNSDSEHIAFSEDKESDFLFNNNFKTYGVIGILLIMFIGILYFKSKNIKDN